MNDAPLRNTTAPASALSCGSYACMLQRSHHKRSAAFGDARMHACRYGGFGEARPSGAKAEKKDGEGPLSKVRMGRMGRSALRGGGGGAHGLHRLHYEGWWNLAACAFTSACMHPCMRAWMAEGRGRARGAEGAAPACVMHGGAARGIALRAPSGCTAAPPGADAAARWAAAQQRAHTAFRGTAALAAMALCWHVSRGGRGLLCPQLARMECGRCAHARPHAPRPCV